MLQKYVKISKNKSKCEIYPTKKSHLCGTNQDTMMMYEEVIKAVEVLRRPLVSTSANFSGEPTPPTFEDIVEGIKSGVDHVVSPAVEGNPTRQASSIMILHEDGSFKILR